MTAAGGAFIERERDAFLAKAGGRPQAFVVDGRDVPRAARTTKRRRTIRRVDGREKSRTLNPIVYLRCFLDNDDALPFVASTVRGGETDMSDLMNPNKEDRALIGEAAD